MDYEFLTMVFTAVIATMMCLVVVGLMTLVGIEMYQAKKKAEQRIPMSLLAGPGGPLEGLEGIMPIGVAPAPPEGEEEEGDGIKKEEVSKGQYL